MPSSANIKREAAILTQTEFLDLEATKVLLVICKARLNEQHNARNELEKGTLLLDQQDLPPKDLD